VIGNQNKDKAVASIVERARVIDQVFLGRPGGFVFPVVALLAIYGVFVGAADVVTAGRSP
jgi:hypothetical protein